MLQNAVRSALGSMPGEADGNDGRLTVQDSSPSSLREFQGWLDRQLQPAVAGSEASASASPGGMIQPNAMCVRLDGTSYFPGSRRRKPASPDIAGSGRVGASFELSKRNSLAVGAAVTYDRVHTDGGLFLGLDHHFSRNTSFECGFEVGPHHRVYAKLRKRLKHQAEISVGFRVGVHHAIRPGIVFGASKQVHRAVTVRTHLLIGSHTGLQTQADFVLRAGRGAHGWLTASVGYGLGAWDYQGPSLALRYGVTRREDLYTEVRMGNPLSEVEVGVLHAFGPAIRHYDKDPDVDTQMPSKDSPVRHAYHAGVGFSWSSYGLAVVLRFNSDITSFHVPILVLRDTDVSLTTSLVTVAVPLLAAAVVEWIFGLYRSTAKTAAERHRLAAERSFQEALDQQSAMRDRAAQSVAAEAAKGPAGLLVIQAVYGYWTADAAGLPTGMPLRFHLDGHVLSAPSAIPPPRPPSHSAELTWLDVTIPLQFLAQSGVLRIAGCRKSNMLGFAKPLRPENHAPDAQHAGPRLFVRYRHNGLLTDVVFSEREAVNIPSLQP